MTRIFTASLTWKLASWTLVELRIERRNSIQRDAPKRAIICRGCPVIIP